MDAQTKALHNQQIRGRSYLDANALSAPKCPECQRTFDLTQPKAATEWYYGHDCEEEG